VVFIKIYRSMNHQGIISRGSIVHSSSARLRLLLIHDAILKALKEEMK